jgi:hypothetical protein
MRASNKRLYADLGDKLGLSKEKSGQLIDLLTDQQMEGFGQRRDMSQEEVQRYIQEKQTRDAQAISDLIGPDKAEQFEDYQKSMPARHEFDMLARQLEGSDAALSAEQSKKLLDVYIAERNRVPMPEYSPDMDQAEYAQNVSAWQEDYQRRVSDQATGILNTTQQTAYNEIQQAQKEMRDQFAAAAANAPPGSRRGLMRGGGNVMFGGPMMGMSSGATVLNAPAPPPPAQPKKQ